MAQRRSSSSAPERELLIPQGPLHPDAGPGLPGERFPLADWRALVCPQLPDESFACVHGNLGDRAILADAALISKSGTYAVLPSEDMILLPGAPWWRTRLRSIQCPVTDPVSFALLRGAKTARFPNAPGWSVVDVARRAVAEHGAWLRGEPGRWSIDTTANGRGGELALLLTSARAALLFESCAERAPRLPLSVSATAKDLAARSPTEASIAAEAYGHYKQFVSADEQPPPDVVDALRGVVQGLGAFAA